MKPFLRLSSLFLLSLVLAISGCGGGGGGDGGGGATGSGGGAPGPLEGAWRSNALLTTWCFSGANGLITTDSNNGVPGQQFTGLTQMTFAGTSMTYYINLAAVTSNGVFLYNNPINPPTGPNTQPYTLDPSGTFFTAGNGTYTKIAASCSTTPTATPATTTPAATTGQIAVYTTRATTPTGSISVTIDNANAGALTTYFTTAPTCGAPGTITQTLAAGSSHTLSAASGTLTWGPATFTVPAGGCLTYALN